MNIKIARPPEINILQIGDPRLRTIAEPVLDLTEPAVIEDARMLYRALQSFRKKYGFGRAIAAPQLGIKRRMIAIHLKEWPSLIFNPEITWKSRQTMTLWDDCMCFPFLLVKVSRAQSVSLSFLDKDGQLHYREHCDAATSELLQHEIDHLDGILAVDHALDKESLISRATFEKNKDYFFRQVDFRPEV
jgi:peptide deformylase